MLRDWKSGFPGSGSRRATLPLGHVMATNNSGADLAFGSAALYVDNAFLNTEGSPRADWDPRKGALTLVALQNILSNPTTPIGGMAITTEPIADGKMGQVAIAGLAVLILAGTTVGYVRPAGSTLVRDHWGFGRILTYDTDEDFAIVNLSDSRFQVFYTLTANMAAGSANATLSPAANSWSTTVHDPHGIAAWQTTGDTGFVEWRGDRWCVTIPLCD